MAIKNADPQNTHIERIEEKSTKPNPEVVAMILDRIFEWQFEQEIKRIQTAAAAAAAAVAVAVAGSGAAGPQTG
jgi:hypothetical protein